jgi:hypothetical protein
MRLSFGKHEEENHSHVSWDKLTVNIIHVSIVEGKIIYYHISCET